MTAAAGIRRRHQQEATGVADMGVGAGDDDLAGFDRLAQRVQHLAREFGELVHEQHAVMREADLARPRTAAAAHDGGH